MRAPGCVPDCTSISRVAVERVEGQARSERGLHHRYRQPVPELVTLPLERCVRHDVHRHEQVAPDSAARRGRSPAGEPQSLTVVDAGHHQAAEAVPGREPAGDRLEQAPGAMFWTAMAMAVIGDLEREVAREGLEEQPQVLGAAPWP